MLFEFQNNSDRQGLAIITALGFLVLSMGIVLTLAFITARFKIDSRHFERQIHTQIETKDFSNRVRKIVLAYVQEAIATAQDLDLEQLRIQIENQIQLDDRPNGNSLKILSLRCVGQGSTPDGSCDSSPVLPKIFDLSVQTTDRATSTNSLLSAEIQIQNAGLSSYAFLIKNEMRPEIRLGSAVFAGLFGVNFHRPSEEEDFHRRRIRFETQNGSIVFQNAFVTNLGNPQEQFVIPNAARVRFEQGIISNPEGVNFQNIDNLLPQLKAAAEDQENTAALGGEQTSPECSKVTLHSNSSAFDYFEYTDRDCSIPNSAAQPSGPIQGKEIASNEVIYARGNKVILETQSPNGLTSVGNIAIVTDGNVHLHSSIRRSPSLDPLNGFPSVISPKDLIVSAEMASLLPGHPKLKDVSSVTTQQDQPTIEVDLSYISVSNGASSGSLQVDPELLSAVDYSQATNLGKARFSGLYISDQTPTTRLLFDGSSAVEGFSETEWSYPSALSAIPTDWFKTQLAGGALQAHVTRYEIQTTQIQEALSRFSSSGD
jgi:hypothetical protein